jgi:3-methyladenine DNA glycosylase AlkD
MTSAITVAARDFVAAHLPEATRAGTELGELVDDPEAFLRRLQTAYDVLADPAYQEGQRSTAPGLADAVGVRMPLITAVAQGIRRRTRGVNSGSLLLLADRLLRDRPSLEQRLLAFSLLERTIERDPERTWQVLRHAASRAGEWITIDSLAHPYGKGILAEPVRWAEIEQLAYSASRWERRLAGSTIATIPFINRTVGRRPEIAARALPIIANLIGDSEPDVQKALSWALRSLALADRGAVAEFLDRESDRAAATGDGQRAWVIRDALVAIDADRAARIRPRLVGIRRQAGGPSTSEASAIATAFWAVNPDLQGISVDQGMRQATGGVRS